MAQAESNVLTFARRAEKALETADALESFNSGRLHGSGGGGDNGGMDRLTNLEKRVDNIDNRLGRIEGDVSTLKGDVAAVRSSIASLDAKLDIGSIRASVEKSHTDIYKWIVTIIAVIGAIYFGLQRVAPVQTPEPGSSAQAPVIINIPPVTPQTSPPQQ